MHCVRMTPLRMATLAREISANVTGRDSNTLVLFSGGDESCLSDVIVGLLLDEWSFTVAENGRDVEITYLKLVPMY